MDQEKRDFKRQELEHELGHERPSPTSQHHQRSFTDHEAEAKWLDKWHKGFAAHQKKVNVQYVDKEGVAPNGGKYNKLYVIDAADLNAARHQEHLFDKHEWGAKKVVDKHESKFPDGSMRVILFIVDNHKYGYWKPWADDEVKESATAGATSSANIGTVVNPNISPGKARGKKSYTGTPGHSGTKAPPQPKIVQPKTSTGTAVNALDIKGTSLFGGPALKR